MRVGGFFDSPSMVYTTDLKEIIHSDRLKKSCDLEQPIRVLYFIVAKLHYLKFVYDIDSRPRFIKDYLH